MAGTIATAYIQIEPSTKGISSKLDGEMSSAGESGGKSYSSGFASVVGGIGKVALGAVAAGAAAVGKVVSDSVSAFGEYEQLVGGVETLFDNSANIESFRQALLDAGEAGAAVEEKIRNIDDPVQTVMKNASEAYKTAGLSANEYMETVTSMAAALNQSTGDMAVSADMADMAIRDMSDNANKMGTSMESIQHAYQGFSKQNYTMLDNLKLGYGGTKAEMERLLEDATALSGVEYDLDSYADIVDAIHVIQTEMGITGTTALEASTTIQGSAASMSAAWQNLITGMSNGDADMGALITEFIESVTTFAGNIIPVIETALQGVSTLVSTLAPVIAEELPALFLSVLPELLDAGTQVLESLATGIIEALPVLMPMALEVIGELGNFIIQNLPLLLEIGFQIILQLATALTEALPTLIPTIVEVVLTICEFLVDNIDLLIDASIQLITALAEGLIIALPILIEKAPIIIAKLVIALISAMPKILEAGKKIIFMLRDGVESVKEQLFAKASNIVATLKSKFMEKVKEFVSVGKNIVDGIKQGISDAWNNLVEWLSGLCDNLLDIVKKALGIASPSKEFANQVGQWIPAGIAVGIEKGMGVLDDTINSMTADMVVDSLNTSAEIESSIASSKYDASGIADTKTDLNALLSLMTQYLPRIADNGNVNITLEGDAGRLFRLMQSEQRRNTQLVGI